MAHHDVSLPTGLQYGSMFGFGLATILQTTASGHDYRLARQAQARHRYRPLKALQSRAEAIELKEFVIGRRGALHSWNLKDELDNTSNADGVTAPSAYDQELGTGDGSRTQFQLVKKYDDAGPEPYQRTIRIASSVTVAVAGAPVSFTGPNADGVVTLAAAPGLGEVVTAGFRFEVPVRFTEQVDTLAGLRADAYSSWSMENLECVEELDETQWPELWYGGGATPWIVTSDVTLAFGDGRFQSIQHNQAGGINAFLPAPDWCPGGDAVLVVHNSASSSGSLQLRDDAGNTVGSALAAGTTKRLALSFSGSTATWTLY